MAEKQTIVINDVEYIFEDMTSDQQVFVRHIADLERKIGSAKFNLDQLQVGKDAFMSGLEKSLKQEDKIEEAS